MSVTSNPPAIGLPGRMAGVVRAPRRTLAAAACLGPWQVLATWAVLLALWAAAGGWLLAQPVGRQAVVDERVRVVEALGGTVDDPRYAAWQAAPPYATYLTSGGRVLLLPVTTLAVAAALYVWARRHTAGVRFLAALSVVVHASVVLAAQQVVVTPLHFVRESLTSPFNLAAVLPAFDEGSIPARILGTVELFGLWWAVLVAVGASVLTGRGALACLAPVLGTYLGVAAGIGAVTALMGGF